MDLRQEFPVFERAAFLNAGSDGPLPQVAVDAARDALDRALHEGRRIEHFQARADAGAKLRAIYAERLGAQERDVALTTSTSEGLARVIVGMGLGEGDEILVADAEHPGLLGPVLSARARGVAVRSGPLTTLADHVTEATSLVACSHVGWSTGELADPRLADVEPPVLLDGAQGIGAVPTDVASLGCAAYAGAGQKWLCGADGTGMLWLEPSFSERVEPGAPPYDAFVDTSLGLASEFHPDASRYGTPTIPHEGLVCSVAAAEVLAAHGWDAVLDRGASLAAQLADRLTDAGFTVAPRGQTTLVSWEDDDPAGTSARLAEQGVIIRSFPGLPYLRASVGAWNDDSDLDRLLEALT